MQNSAAAPECRVHYFPAAQCEDCRKVVAWRIRRIHAEKDFAKNVQEDSGMDRKEDRKNMPNEQGVLECLHVARQIIAEWVRDENGRVNVHPDVISKAVNAA